MDSVVLGGGANYVSIGTSVNTSTLVGGTGADTFMLQAGNSGRSDLGAGADTSTSLGLSLTEPPSLVELAPTPSLRSYSPVVVLMQEQMLTASTSVLRAMVPPSLVVLETTPSRSRTT